MPNPTRFMKRCVSLAKETVVGRPAPAVEKGTGGFADWDLITILCLKEREEETYRSVIEWLEVAEDVRRPLNLTRKQLPDYTTVQKAMDALTMAICRRLLQRTTALHELGEVAAIDASSFDRVAASRRYATRTE